MLYPRTLAAVRNGSVYCENMFLSATQTPCIHEFLNLLGSVAFDIFADNFLVFIFDFSILKGHFVLVFSSHPIGQKGASIRMAIIKCDDFPLSLYLIRSCTALTLNFLLYYSVIPIAEMINNLYDSY